MVLKGYQVPYKGLIFFLYERQSRIIKRSIPQMAEITFVHLADIGILGIYELSGSGLGDLP